MLACQLFIVAFVAVSGSGGLNDVVKRALALRQELKDKHKTLMRKEHELAEEQHVQQTEIDKMTRSLNDKFARINSKVQSSSLQPSFIQRHRSTRTGSESSPRKEARLPLSPELAKAQEDRQNALESLHHVIDKMHASLASIKKSMVQTSDGHESDNARDSDSDDE